MDSFSTHDQLRVGDRTVRLARLPALAAQGHDLSRLPYSLKILLENLLRREDGEVVTRDDIQAVLDWDPQAPPSQEIAFMPARVLLQDFTGVPAVVDLAALRDAMRELGGDPAQINPQQPVELVIDHSVQVDEYGKQAAFLINVEREFERNRERYAFLKWGQKAFASFRVVPPGTGICHQVNLEYLARVVIEGEGSDGEAWAWPDTLVGTDSHTTMINGLGVLGWGVGGIEAEAAMLGQPISMLLPQVVGFRLTGELAPGATATDLVLTVTEMLREKGVVGKFVEFYGPGLKHLPLADRATIGNMAPEYGATCGIFPVDQVSLDYLRFTGRDATQVELVEAYMREQGLFHDAGGPEPAYSDTLDLDLATVEPSLAGPKRPQDRILLSGVKRTFLDQLPDLRGTQPPTPRPTTLGRWESEGGDGETHGAAAVATAVAGPATAVMEETGGARVQRQGTEHGSALPRAASPAALAGAGPSATTVDGLHGIDTDLDGERFKLQDGSVVIAAITSCTNTSNPSVMLAAGLLARSAVERGLQVKPWVKTSLAPGSKVVTEYLEASGLMDPLEALHFYLVGYGCTTCIGNSGPLPPPIKEAVDAAGLVAVSVLSGNRNFEGRISPDVRANFLASPPLVVAYALAGRIDIDLESEPLGEDPSGAPVYLRDIWPARDEIDRAVHSFVRSDMFRREYASVFDGDERWDALPVPAGTTYAWDEESTYVRQPPFFRGITREPEPIADLAGARALAVLGDSVTTDHISPAGAIQRDSPAGRYLIEHGVEPRDFNSYGSRRGNHEVMMRGTFANVRLRNRLVPEIEGGFTLHLPSQTPMTIFDAAERYREEGVPLIVLAGREYGTGSSRDWAAKGPALLGVDAVLAASYERIHRSNLIGMGVVPLQYRDGQSVEELGLTGQEIYSVEGLAEALAGPFRKGLEVTVSAAPPDGEPIRIPVLVRLDTPQEVAYYRHGGILAYVLRNLAG